MKTIKQIADSIGVDKQRVYRHIRKNRITASHQKRGVMYYDEAAETQIIQRFSNIEPHHEVHHDVHQTTSLDAVIDMLKAELEIKNEQIRELNARLAESNAALVAAQQSAQAAQTLHAGTMQKQLIDSAALHDAPAEPAGLFARLFRRR